MTDLTIGDAARLSGVRVNTIRFYEGRGLIPPPPRSDGNRRLYDGATVARLRFIRHARALGFGLEAIGELLALQGQPGAECQHADSIARRQLAQVERRLTQLGALRDELRRMTEGCDGGAVAQCKVIETLADHALCQFDHGGENDPVRPL
jgi:DNA-binding transcriptional MerR regulator